MAYLFTSESVVRDTQTNCRSNFRRVNRHFLAFDANSKVACETLVTTGQVILAGEVKSNTYLDVQQIARDVIKKIGYNYICLKPILVAYFLLFTNNQQI
jgi:S-adenosylmethionine synthetase